MAQRLTRHNAREKAIHSVRTVTALLGLEEALPGTWPEQAAVARFLGVSRARVGQVVGKVVERWANRDKALTRLREDVARLLTEAGGAMTAEELGEAILAARGSVLEEPQRSRLGRAVARAAVEVERTMSEPRYLVRRDEARTTVALHPALADYAARLGDQADELAREDPLATPARVAQVLRAVAAPVGFEPMTDPRLLRLAAAASRGAALSSRQEIYPRGMDALRTLKLAQGALFGVRVLSVGIRSATAWPVATRRPSCCTDRPPPRRTVYRRRNWSWTWDPAALEGRGGYVNLTRGTSSVSFDAASARPERRGSRPSVGRDPLREPVTPAEADARQFEEKLRRSLKDDGSLSPCKVPPWAYVHQTRRGTGKTPLRGSRLPTATE